MDTKDLEAYIVLYEKGGLRGAATELFMTPQALSRILQKMENELGVLLFHRSKQGMQPTRMGDYFYREAIQICKNQQFLQKNLLALSGQKKDISLVCSYGVMAALPYTVIMDFEQQNPDTSLIWREYPDKQAISYLLDDEYSLGLLVLTESELFAENVILPLFQKKVVALVYEGHPLYEKQVLRLEDLKDERIIMEGDDFWINESFRTRCLENGFSPNIVIETGDISFCHRLCSMRQGIGISIDFVADYIQDSNLRAIPIDAEEFSWPVCLTYKKNVILTEKEKEFCNYL